MQVRAAASMWNAAQLYTLRASITRFIRGVKGGGGRPLRKQAICLHNVPPPCIISLFYTPFTAGKRGVVDGGGGGRGGVSFINQENSKQWLPGTAFTPRCCLLVCLTTFSLICRIGLYTQHTSSAFKIAILS
jgi:hypothetical protein